MLPNNKLFVVWVLDGLDLCSDVIRWEIFEWLVDYEREIKKEYGVNWREKNQWNDIFDWACSRNWLDLMKWLWKVCSIEPTHGECNLIDEHLTECNIAVNVCEYDNLDMMMWLWDISNGKLDIDFQYLDTDIFTHCCSCGSFKIAKWLENIMEINTELAFVICSDIEGMKWILTNYGINNIMEAFIYHCECRIMTVVNWLLDVYIMDNIEELLHPYFKEYCERGDTTMVNLLCSLYDGYSYKIVDDKIIGLIDGESIKKNNVKID